MRLTLRGRLTLWFALVMMASLAAFGFLAYTIVSRQMTANLDISLNKVITGLDIIIRENTRKTEAVARHEPPETEPAPQPQPPTRKGRGRRDALAFLRKHSKTPETRTSIKPLKTETAQQQPGDVDAVWTAIYEHIVLNPRNFLIQVMDSSGAIVYRSRNLHNDSLHIARSVIRSTPDSITHFTNIAQVIPGDTSGSTLRVAVARTYNAVIIAAYPLDEVQTLLQELFSSMTFLIPAVLLISITGGWLLARASLKPVDAITRTAQDITASNLSRRLPSLKANDEIARLSETLNDMISRLENSFEQIRQFTADASHELRTPLTILTGELELALRTTRNTQEYKEIVSSALQEVLRLSRLVEYLLLLSRTDIGKVSLQLERTDLAEVLADLADATSILGEAKNIHINYRHSENLIIEADHAKLYQMFLNILDNAIKYTPEGGLITITLHREGTEAVVNVRDTGIGISQDHQKKIFDRFYRVDKARSREVGGAGLGLSIVLWTAQAHGGSITVESESGQGSTFIVRLPLIHDDALQPADEQPVRRQRFLPPAFELPRFLNRRGKLAANIDQEKNPDKKIPD